MEKIIFMLIIAVASAAPKHPKEIAIPADFECNQNDIAKTKCEGPKDCLYQNDLNCNSFIQCVPQYDGSGKPEGMPCPSDLKWNDNMKKCDYPKNTTCPRQPSTPDDSSSPPAEEPTEPSQTTTTEAETDAPTTTEAETDAPTTTEAETDAPTTTEVETDAPTTTEVETDAPTTTEAATTQSTTTTSAPDTTTQNGCGDDGSADDDLDLDKLCKGCRQRRLIPNPNSNQRYIQCNGGEDGRTNSVNKCAPGLLFDSEELTCNYAGLVNSTGPKK